MRYQIPPDRIRQWVEANFDVKKVRKSGRELVIVNPLYDTHKARFNINTETGGCHDWNGDEWAGSPNPRTGKRPCNIIRFVQLYRGCSFREALRELMGSDALIYTPEPSKPREEPEEASEGISFTLPPGYRPLTHGDNILTGPCWRYLLKRGYTEKQILEENIHYRGSDILWIYTEFGEQVYCQSRNIHTKQFWFPPSEVTDQEGNIIGELEVTRDHVLYGFDDVPRAEYIILNESIFDKNTIGHHALSTGGVILSEGQLQRIDLIGPKEGIVLAPDNDKAAIENILENAPKLIRRGYKVFFSIPPRIEYVNIEGKQDYTKDWNDLLVGIEFTKPQIIATLNQRLVPFTEGTRLKLRQMLVTEAKTHGSVKRATFF